MIIELTLGTTETEDQINKKLTTNTTMAKYIKNITIQSSQKHVGFLDDLPSIMTITIDLFVGASASMIANWLYQSIKAKTRKILVQKEETILTKDELKRTIEKIYFEEDA